MDNAVIYTIGHSTHEADYFLALLQEYAVDCLIDVRSVAASGHNPQFNQEPLSMYLKQEGITYLHFPDEFGARHHDADLLDENGKVDFEKVRKSWNFRNGVERLWMGLEKGFTIALMCSESEPFDCHRFSMISVALEKDGFQVRHILKDKSLRTNSALEQQLLKKYDKKLPKPDIFHPNITEEDRLTIAYRLRNADIAFSPHEKEPSYKYD